MTAPSLRPLGRATAAAAGGRRPYAVVERSLEHWGRRHGEEAVPRGLLRQLLAEDVAPGAVRSHRARPARQAEALAGTGRGRAPSAYGARKACAFE